MTNIQTYDRRRDLIIERRKIRRQERKKRKKRKQRKG